MVLYILYVKAEIEGITSIAISPTENLCMDIRNPTSDEIREKIVIDPTEYLEQEEGSRQPDHHFAITWEGSKKTSVLTVLSSAELKTMLKTKKKKKGKGDSPMMIRNVTAEDNNEYVPVAAFETRGIEPFAFYPMGGEFVVESEGGLVFEGDDVDFSDDWADYDTENDVSVSVMEFASKFGE